MKKRKKNSGASRKERAEIKRSEADLIKLKSEFECLHNEIGTQNGGYEFEKWFLSL